MHGLEALHAEASKWWDPRVWARVVTAGTGTGIDAGDAAHIDIGWLDFTAAPALTLFCPARHARLRHAPSRIIPLHVAAFKNWPSLCLGCPEAVRDTVRIAAMVAHDEREAGGGTATPPRICLLAPYVSRAIRPEESAYLQCVLRDCWKQALCIRPVVIDECLPASITFLGRVRALAKHQVVVHHPPENPLLVQCPFTDKVYVMPMASLATRAPDDPSECLHHLIIGPPDMGKLRAWVQVLRLGTDTAGTTLIVTTSSALQSRVAKVMSLFPSGTAYTVLSTMRDVTTPRRWTMQQTARVVFATIDLLQSREYRLRVTTLLACIAMGKPVADALQQFLHGPTPLAAQHLTLDVLQEARQRTRASAPPLAIPPIPELLAHVRRCAVVHTLDPFMDSLGVPVWHFLSLQEAHAQGLLALPVPVACCRLPCHCPCRHPRS
jgi:hypothetical protein